jgi:hypothetical protein
MDDGNHALLLLSPMLENGDTGNQLATMTIARERRRHICSACTEMKKLSVEQEFLHTERQLQH